MKKRRFCIAILSLSMIFMMAGCKKKRGDIVVLFTNDTHCDVTNDIGFAGVKAYKDEALKKTKYVTLVDCGDAIQGDTMGAITKGEAIVDIMNYVGYDYAIFGNHEFDYGMDQLSTLTQKANYKYLSCNIEYNGSLTNKLSNTMPYDIVKYGNTKVAYIGVTTPLSTSSSTPTYFMENNEFVYSFSGGNNGLDLYKKLQDTVDEAKNKGKADYVVVLSHLGSNEEGLEPYDSISLINNTTGIDVLLDGHSHLEIPRAVISNKDNKDVLMAQTGTKLNNLGELVITSNGYISLGIISDYDKKDLDTVNYINNIKNQFKEKLEEVVASIDIDLLTTDSSGVRMVRNRETIIGDLVSDAYRNELKADIGMINGGGIRASLKSGEVTYEDIIGVNPFGNMLCKVEVSGSELLDMLEYMYRFVQSEYVIDGKAVGEDGSFQQVSGLKFTIDTSIASTVKVNENEDFISVEGNRRVKDVMVLINGAYENVDTNKTYTICTTDYMIKNGGCGMRLLLADNNILVDSAVLDYQALINYIKDVLNGNLSNYKAIDNRINII